MSVKAKNVGDAANTFKGFVLTVEQEADRDKGPAGRFTLYSDSKSKFDERCANTVTHANFLPTGEVQIDWVAPKEGAGCVIFRYGAVQRPICAATPIQISDCSSPSPGPPSWTAPTRGTPTS